MTSPAIEALTERIREAAASATPLCIRGGGSKDFYGGLPQGEPLSTATLAGVANYEPSELVVGRTLSDLVACRPGLSLQEAARRFNLVG